RSELGAPAVLLHEAVVLLEEREPARGAREIEPEHARGQQAAERHHAIALAVAAYAPQVVEAALHGAHHAIAHPGRHLRDPEALREVAREVADRRGEVGIVLARSL